MKPARYIFLNRDLRMSAGKCAAQAAHAETLALNDFFLLRHDHDLVWVQQQEVLWDKWFGDGHYAKYVMKANDAVQMYNIERYLNDRFFETYMVIDEGHTEETYMVPTAMAVELVDKDDERTASIFSQFRMYKEKRPEPVEAQWGIPWLRRKIHGS
jgi:peptidyl-tRNA hydrolase